MLWSKFAELKAMLDFLYSHPAIGALAYSWGSFEIGRGAHKAGREIASTLSCGIGFVCAMVGFSVATKGSGLVQSYSLQP
jgi:hypothetical protein